MEVGQIFNDILPAITICYPFVLSMENVVNSSENKSEWRQQYLDIERVIGSIDQIRKGQEEKNHLKMEKLYYQLSNDFFADEYDIDKTFNISIPYMHNGDATIEVVEDSGVARHLDRNSSHKIIYGGNEFQDHLRILSENLEPIESVILDNGDVYTVLPRKERHAGIE